MGLHTYVRLPGPFYFRGGWITSLIMLSFYLLWIFIVVMGYVLFGAVLLIALTGRAVAKGISARQERRQAPEVSAVTRIPAQPRSSAPRYAVIATKPGRERREQTNLTGPQAEALLKKLKKSGWTTDVTSFRPRNPADRSTALDSSAVDATVDDRLSAQRATLAADLRELVRRRSRDAVAAISAGTTAPVEPAGRVDRQPSAVVVIQEPKPLNWRDHVTMRDARDGQPYYELKASSTEMAEQIRALMEADGWQVTVERFTGH